MLFPLLILVAVFLIAAICDLITVVIQKNKTKHKTHFVIGFFVLSYTVTANHFLYNLFY